MKNLLLTNIKKEVNNTEIYIHNKTNIFQEFDRLQIKIQLFHAE
jgi:hypothetical protein